MILFIDQPVQVKNQGIDLKGYFRFFSKPIVSGFFDQPEDHGLYGVKGNDFCMVDIVLCSNGILHQVDIIGGGIGEPAAVIFADPKYKPPVGLFLVQETGVMLCARRNQ